MQIKKHFNTLLITALTVLPWAQDAGAATEGSSRTYVHSWESLDESRHHTLYQYLDLDVASPGTAGLSFRFGGWGRVDLADETFGKSSEGEFQYGYIDYAHGKANALARAGRLFVSDGVALHENFDGLYARGDLLKGFSLAFYGGVPVETDEDGRGGDLLYGGRLGFRGSEYISGGASYLKEDNDGEDFREEAGIDLALASGRHVRLDGQSVFNLLDSRWSDHDYRLSLGPYGGWRFIGTVWQVDYDGLFESPATSAFAPAPGESMLLAGGEVEYALAPGMTLSAAFQHYSYDIAASADAISGRLTWAPAGGTFGLVATRVDGAEDALAYAQYRGYASWRFGALDVVLDVLGTFYDEKVNGEDTATTIAVGAGYDISPHLRLGADVEYGSNPFFDEDVRAFLKLLWHFSAGTLAGEEG